MEQEYVLSVKVNNNNGVLLRVAGLFSRRCYSIKSINAAETEDNTISRLTIVVAGDLRVITQIKNQLMKLYDIREVKILNDAVTREHILIRAGRSAEDRHKIIEIANLYRAKPVDVATDSIMLELTGESAKIDSFIDLLKPFGIVKMVRSGITALERD
ncbi:MAG: acetolactate synthase small subunit [Oscillospiraceae bacterium]|nr:acetolactate synthase small subunit [Oscillospiraceae bacterium]MCH5208212.1 acetolactate synthase small subunit [Oscillospiraceae bacterium]